MLDEIQNFFSFSYWKSFFNSSTKKRLFENFFSLSLLQGLNYILPLIVLPYLVRVLGVEKFGLIAFSQAFINYFVILVTYSFNLIAPKEISIYKGDKKKISEIFFTIIFSKIILAFVGFLILIFIVFLVPKFKIHWLLYLLMFELVIWDIIFPAWFFQGMERMKFITIIAFLSKLITVIFIFAFIKNSSHYIYYPILDFAGNLIAGIIAFKIIIKDFGIRILIPNINKIKYYLIDGFSIFLAQVSISIYNNSNTLILGLFTNNNLVGYYAAAEKIINGVKGLIAPASTTVYPYMSRTMKESYKKGFEIARKFLLIMALVFGLISLFIFLFSPIIVKIILGPKYLESIVILRIFSILPLIIVLNNVFGAQTILTRGYSKEFSQIFIFGGLFGIFLSILLTFFFKHIGMAFAWILAEIFVVLLMVNFHKRKRTLKYFFK